MDDTVENKATKATDNLPKFSLHIPDKLSLYTAYMPYVKNGGIFVQTPVGLDKNYSLGQLVIVEFKLSNNNPINFIGSIVWICPINATNKVSGIGVELPDDENSKRLKQTIENTLGQALNSSRATHIL